MPISDDMREEAGDLLLNNTPEEVAEIVEIVDPLCQLKKVRPTLSSRARICMGG